MVRTEALITVPCLSSVVRTRRAFGVTDDILVEARRISGVIVRLRLAEAIAVKALFGHEEGAGGAVSDVLYSSRVDIPDHASFLVVAGGVIAQGSRRRRAVEVGGITEDRGLRPA